MTRSGEIQTKLESVRAGLGHDTLRLRGTDWFAWATAGGSNVVLLTAESGVAEVLITPDAAWILTDAIEAARLQDEELSADFAVHACAWANPDEREQHVRQLVGSARIFSDLPENGEAPLPEALHALKWRLTDSEIARYRDVGQRASLAMREALEAAAPDWTEYQLAAAGAQALWAQGLEPALTLAAGERRVQRYRHPVAKSDPLGRFAMLVFCARGFGLYANLTRFVAFEPLAPEIDDRHHVVAEIEADVLDACVDGTKLSELYAALAAAYQKNGYADEILLHHQGGTTGYRAREIIATPKSEIHLGRNIPLAFNPSLVGAKIEDTFVLGEHGLENLTIGDWPAREVRGRQRPTVLQRS